MRKRKRSLRGESPGRYTNPDGARVEAPFDRKAASEAQKKRATRRKVIAEDVVNFARIQMIDATRSIRERITSVPPGQTTGPEERAENMVIEMRGVGPGEEEPGVQYLLKLGEVALPVIAQHFPGTLWFDRRRMAGRPPLGMRVSPLASALVRFGAPALPYIGALLHSEIPDIRYYAAFVAQEVAHVALIPPLAPLLFDIDDDVREQALGALRPMQRRPEFEHVRELLDIAASSPGTSLEHRTVAIRTMVDLGDALWLGTLVGLLEADEETVRMVAYQALVSLTGHDLGRERAGWEQWAEKNGDRHRLEWLIEALADGNVLLRDHAFQTLVSITGERLDTERVASPEDGKRARDAFRQWWTESGRGRYET